MDKGGTSEANKGVSCSGSEAVAMGTVRKGEKKKAYSALRPLLTFFLRPRKGMSKLKRKNTSEAATVTIYEREMKS